MDILLVPLGSHGDVHPFVGIGLALRRRGHRVRVILNPYFAPLAEAAGLEVIPIGTAEEYVRMASNPMLWRRVRGTQTVLRSIGELVRPMYAVVKEHAAPGKTVVLASTLALGARAAEEHLGITTATVHLQPSIFFSACDPPKLSGMLLAPWTPMWLRRFQFALGDRLLDPMIAPPLNAFRRELGLPPVRKIISHYVHSTRRVIGLFPEWYAPPQPDWPPQTRLADFPMFDERGVTALSDRLREFLDEGEPPIAFTPGSAMWSGQRFFQEAVSACRLLGRRGILLTRHPDHLPPALPAGVLHVDYAPFSELLPKCAAMVHHGGIGTSAQAMAAGVPQLVTPHAHDQPDNAGRMVKLGVARVLPPGRFKARRIARELRALLDSTQVEKCCRSVAAKFVGVDPTRRVVELVEELEPRAAS